jgi:hypothetical protein
MKHKDNTLTTNQLFYLACLNKHKIIEAALVLNFNGRATHFISMKKSLILDEGIDGELMKWRKNEFIYQYENAQWIIDQIV